MGQGSARSRFYEREEEDLPELESPGARDAENTLRLAHHAQRLKAIETGIDNLAQSMAIFRATQRRLLRRQTIISLAVGGICLLATLIAAIIVSYSHRAPSPPRPQAAVSAPAPMAELPAPTPSMNMAEEAESTSDSYITQPSQPIIKPVALGRAADATRGNMAPLPAAKLTPPKARPPAEPPRQIGAFENAVKNRLAASKQSLPASWRPMFERDLAGDNRGKLQIAAKFLKGEDVKADPVFAVSLIRQSAIAGNREAMMWLAQSYEAGNFGRADMESALRWYTNAAKANVAAAYGALGRLYEKGIDGAPDKDAALAWYQRAAEAGDSKSAEAVARLTRASATASNADTAPDALLAAEPRMAAPAAREGGPLATPVVASTGMDPERLSDIRAAQRMLKVLGYKVDKDDGQLGPQTQAAIRAYQRDRAAYPDGEFTPELLESLTKEIRYGSN
jgi:TPR repeat protein